MNKSFVTSPIRLPIAVKKKKYDDEYYDDVD